MNHIFFVRFVVLKRPDFQSQKCGMLNETSIGGKIWRKMELGCIGENLAEFG